jgi:glyoxylase-like metal-dependent hydrolase (beta-lactamase superfamily II)
VSRSIEFFPDGLIMPYTRLSRHVLFSTRVAAGLLLAVGVFCSAPVHAQTDLNQWTASLANIRTTAALVPGRRPLRLNVLKFAESRRTKNFSIKGAPADPSVQARTAFQVMYADGHIMVDAGMDQQVHRFFGRGVDEPYDPAAAGQVERALTTARLIVVTHEHGDHVAGVIRSSRAQELAPRTILTRSQVQTLLTTPQMPEIALTPELAARYLVVDYDKYFPLAAGIVLIKAAGHTPGSQMVYIALESGREYLLIGDAAWHMDGVRLVKGKDAPWITEDQNAILSQLTWLNELSRTEPRLVIVASHDAEEHAELIQKGMLGGRFE